MSAEFSGRVLMVGVQAPDLVKQLQNALRNRGYPSPIDGNFSEQMESVVRLFQAQHSDDSGLPLKVDGQVGYHTWTALFGVLPRAVYGVAPLLAQAIATAASQEGQMEEPKGQNKGGMVDEYLRAAGLDPNVGTPDSRPWCMCFVFWVFQQASKQLTRGNPVPKTASCHHHWDAAADLPGVHRIAAKEALEDRSLVKPGLVFVLDFGGGQGHTGIVETLLPGGPLQTIEGNSNRDGSRNGVGVFRLKRRKLSDAELKGFIDYSAA
ncbi:peptidoglycan-binding protein [Paraburkholderia graminis]|uniref:peptidoglycan-binding protein n=1 Tax=Paraburkholderia graminis TaxID=60548 RepID=UPI0009DB91B5